MRAFAPLTLPAHCAPSVGCMRRSAPVAAGQPQAISIVCLRTILRHRPCPRRWPMLPRQHRWFMTPPIGSIRRQVARRGLRQEGLTNTYAIDAVLDHHAADRGAAPTNSAVAHNIRQTAQRLHRNRRCGGVEAYRRSLSSRSRSPGQYPYCPT